MQLPCIIIGRGIHWKNAAAMLLLHLTLFETPRYPPLCSTRRQQVDLVIQAHVHDYERSYPVARGAAAALNYSSPRYAAPVYVTNGAAGNRENNDMPKGGQPWLPPQNASRAVSFGLLTVTEGTLQWEQVVSADGSRQDAFTMHVPARSHRTSGA